MKLIIDGISCVRGGRHVLEGISFTLEPGIASILTGPNGSGKSTLMRVVAGLVDQQSGTMTWMDDDVVMDPDETQPGSLFHYVGHLDAIKPSLSVEENLSFWAGLYGGSTNLVVALEKMELAALRDVPGAFLSAGQRKRLSLARLLLVRRPLWILDEPSVSLDVGGVALVADLMKRHCQSGGMLFVTTHVDIGLSQEHTNSLKLTRNGTLQERRS